MSSRLRLKKRKPGSHVVKPVTRIAVFSLQLLGQTYRSRGVNERVFLTCTIRNILRPARTFKNDAKILATKNERKKVKQENRKI